ncbi:hypothetical protein D3C72_2226490 [compost metagenome]
MFGISVLVLTAQRRICSASVMPGCALAIDCSSTVFELVLVPRASRPLKKERPSWRFRKQPKVPDTE